MIDMLLTIRWNFDPVFWRITDTFDIRYYGLMWAVAIGLGSVLADWFVKREGLPEKVSWSMFCYGAFATIIGSRLGASQLNSYSTGRIDLLSTMMRLSPKGERVNWKSSPHAASV